MAKKITETTLYQRIGREREIKNRISGIISEISSLGNIQSLIIASNDAHLRVKSYIYIHGNGSESNIESGIEKAELLVLKEEAEKCSKARKEAVEEDSRLREELTELKAELQDFPYGARLVEVIDHQAKITEAAQVVASLREAITGQQAIIDENSGFSAEGLSKARQDLMAEAALGKDVSKEIEKLDDEVMDHSFIALSKDDACKDAENAIKGLSRKLEDAESLLSELETGKGDILVNYLHGEAELAGEEYLKAAKKLQNAFSRILSLESISQKFRSNVSFSVYPHEIDIPIFRLKAFADCSNGLGKVLKFTNLDLLEDIQAEKTRLKDLGINL